jgi:DNA-binding transcriptional regulator of glucitol operon
MVVPYVPIVALISAATIALAAGVWWHWTQFSTEYRMST